MRGRRPGAGTMPTVGEPSRQAVGPPRGSAAEARDDLEQSRARSLEDRRRAAAAVDRYIDGIGEPAPVVQDDERDLVRRAKAGDAEAREELIDRFMPLIVSIARSYRVDGLDFADLVQEGCVGLLRALARYEPDRETPLGAFAAWWIRHSLQELRSDFLRPLRLPPKALRQLAQLKSEHYRIYASEHREPSLSELAERTAIGDEQAEALLRADAVAGSLDEPVSAGDGETGVFGDLLEDPLSAEAYEEALDAIAGEQLKALLGRLSEREREILDARFGFAGRRVERLTEVAERLGVSAERVRQLEERALAKLRQAA